MAMIGVRMSATSPLPTVAGVRVGLGRPRDERVAARPGLDPRDPHTGAVELLAGALAHRRYRPFGGRIQRALQRLAAGPRAGQQQVALALSQRADGGAD